VTRAGETAKTYVIQGMSLVAPDLAPGLYLVSTPIGNLRDISLRALETLAAADVVLCEDTRTSARLLDHFLIRTHREALHEHNEMARVPGLIDRLRGGAALALISDAGTPLLSDPGFPLVRAAREASLPVYAIPGASALLAALASAGLPTDAFSFLGFLPSKTGARAARLADLADRSETLVFYESPRRLGATLAAMTEAFGPERAGVVALELTKKFERLASGPLAELSARFAETQTKGEAVILVAGAAERTATAEEWRPVLAAALGDMPLRAAVDEVTTRFGLKRKEVYDAALTLRGNK
jgi:16S rRNA (cytidine1402-2'-O)-methyltransferase